MHDAIYNYEYTIYIWELHKWHWDYASHDHVIIIML